MGNTSDAWAAGFIDGEGCISIVRRSDRGIGESYAVRVSAAQVDPRPLRVMQAMYGGSIRLSRASADRPKWRDAWVWTLQTRQAAEMLLRLTPYLVSKREQAEMALKLQSIKLSQGHRLTPVVLSQQRELFARIKEAKRVE